KEVPLAPVNGTPEALRDNLRKARDLLAAAGWTYRDGALRNAKGEPFTVEYQGSTGARTSRSSRSASTFSTSTFSPCACRGGKPRAPSFSTAGARNRPTPKDRAT